MPEDIELRIELVPDHSIGIYYESNTAGQQTEQIPFHAEGFANGVILITKQLKRKAMLGGKAAVCFRIIGADTDDLRPLINKIFVHIPERTGLGRTSGRIILRIKVKDDRLTEQVIGRDDLAVLVF